MAQDGKKIAEQQKENIRLQNEYNDALKMSSSISSAIIKSIDDEIDYRTELGKKVKEFNDSLKSSITSLETSNDIATKLVEIEAEKIRITRSYFGANREVGQEMLRSLDIAQETLNIEQQRVAIIERVDRAANDLSDSLSNSFDELINSARNIPVIGGLLGKLGDTGSTVIREKLGNAAMSFTTKFAGGLRSGQGAMMALKGASVGLGTTLMAALTSPLVIIGLIAAGIGLAIKRFSELDKAASSFRDTTDLLISQTSDTARNIKEISVDFAQIGVSAEDASKAAADFTNEFGGLEQPSKGVLSSMVALNKNFGIGTDEASKLNKVFQNIGGLSEEQSQYLIGQTVSMAKMAGVAPQKVIKDMADNSELAYRYFQGSPQELAKAAVQAAKLGTSIGEAGKVADNLLDFENSITAELEASAILGKNLNFGRARYLASTGSVLEAQQAVNDEVAKLGDLSKLNTFQQDALTKATGMTYESLLNQQRIRERFGRLGEKDLASAMALMESGKALEDISAKDLANQTQRMAKDEQRAGQMDKLSNAASALGTSFMDMLAPIADLLIPVLFDVTKFLGDILIPIFGLIGSILGIIGTVVMVVWKIAAAIVSAIITPIMSAFSLITDFFTQIDAQFAKILSYFDPIREFADNFSLPSLGSMFSSDDEMDRKTATTRATRTSVTNSDFSNTTQAEKQTESISVNADDSVNDGVIQNGQVVSTHPEDFLIATKNPTGLAESMAGGMTTTTGLSQTMNGGNTISMEGVIAELRELKAAFLANKDVYMDRTKVTTLIRRTTERATDNNFGTLTA